MELNNKAKKFFINSQVSYIKKRAKIDGDLRRILRKKGRVLKSGDIFEVPWKEAKGYFQFLYKDNGYMAGHLIRGLSYKAEKHNTPTLDNIMGGGFHFYTYTRVFEGMELGLWTKIGDRPIEQDFKPPLFRDTVDSYAEVKRSKNWFLWTGNQDNRVNIGEMLDEYKNIDIVGIFPPRAIVEWLKTGWHGYKWPE